ncbi:MAG: hypothetical protein QXU44_04660 [Candidatus Caldarchaeum sp.]
MIEIYQNAILLYDAKGVKRNSLIAKKKYNPGVTTDLWVECRQNGKRVRRFVENGHHVVENGVLIEGKKIRVRNNVKKCSNKAKK